jgi:Xaa-Pro aminopeptidase
VPDTPLLVSPEGVARVQEALRDMEVDGWLLYEFRGQNWISARVLGTEWTTRRAYILIPREGEPRGLIHAIESSSWRHWPWPVETYAGWEEMEAKLSALLEGCERVALETSPGAAVPTVDLVPAGTVELVRRSGVEPVSSGDLVSAFFSAWTGDQLSEHRKTAEIIARIAKDGFQEAGRAIREGSPHSEGSLTRWILDAMEQAGIRVDADTHVAVGRTAADPHYAPPGDGEVIAAGELLLIDLWGRPTDQDVFSDQTWMGVMGTTPPGRAREIWEIVRDSRDAGVALLRERAAAGAEVLGYEVDDACRKVIEDAGFGEYFIHRTGHSMDLKLHGSGPNLDNLETRDDRRLIPGVGFSVEPGIYIPGEIGVRTEINVFMGPDGPEVNPGEIQRDLILVDV